MGVFFLKRIWRISLGRISLRVATGELQKVSRQLPSCLLRYILQLSSFLYLTLLNIGKWREAKVLNV
ncbi:hypothetical protein XELAEV_18019925mg [Xenopus laevis]|uniref:Uncharacterized protein n=1 Tax=Xenopus laevis TaxID=8355 RepID=A0A974D6U2_XENLA|nr:hypothetical protein XELAEV_18019925mg [Xenopus laevis]